MKYEVKFTNQFKKDLKLAKKQNKNLDKLFILFSEHQSEMTGAIFYAHRNSGYYKIAVGLETDGILTGAGKSKWHTSTLNKILRNEKYIGDVLLQICLGSLSSIVYHISNLC
jgi:hypothetical protein